MGNCLSLKKYKNQINNIIPYSTKFTNIIIEKKTFDDADIPIYDILKAYNYDRIVIINYKISFDYQIDVKYAYFNKNNKIKLYNNPKYNMEELQKTNFILLTKINNLIANNNINFKNILNALKSMFEYQTNKNIVTGHISTYDPCLNLMDIHYKQYAIFDNNNLFFTIYHLLNKMIFIIYFIFSKYNDWTERNCSIGADNNYKTNLLVYVINLKCDIDLKLYNYLLKLNTDTKQDLDIFNYYKYVNAIIESEFYNSDIIQSMIKGLFLDHNDVLNKKYLMYINIYVKQLFKNRFVCNDINEVILTLFGNMGKSTKWCDINSIYYKNKMVNEIISNILNYITIKANTYSYKVLAEKKIFFSFYKILPYLFLNKSFSYIFQNNYALLTNVIYTCHKINCKELYNDVFRTLYDIIVISDDDLMKYIEMFAKIYYYSADIFGDNIQLLDMMSTNNYLHDIFKHILLDSNTLLSYNYCISCIKYNFDPIKYISDNHL